MRSLWGELTNTPAERQTAYALVSITFEVAVMTAPVLVAVLTALASPAVGGADRRRAVQRGRVRVLADRRARAAGAASRTT